MQRQPQKEEPTEFTMPRQSNPVLYQKQGSKELAKGTMKWSLLITTEGMSPDLEFKPVPSAMIQIVFTPKRSYSPRTITFMQTVAQTRVDATSPKKPRMDVLTVGQRGAKTDDFTPFYGADWDPTKSTWTPEEAAEGFRNAPSTASDSSAYLYDAPAVPVTTMKMFESVVVVTETSETLGALKWGVGGGLLLGGRDNDCTDVPSDEFGAAVERFYATPTTDEPDREERYDVILDEFKPNDVTLTASQEKQLDPIVAKLGRELGKLVRVAGFADAMDKDPSRTSERRAQAVAKYLVGRGVPDANIRQVGFGTAWARYPPSMKDGRNRRVQVRLVGKSPETSDPSASWN